MSNDQKPVPMPIIKKESENSAKEQCYDELVKILNKYGSTEKPLTPASMPSVIDSVLNRARAVEKENAMFRAVLKEIL